MIPAADASFDVIPNNDARNHMKRHLQLNIRLRVINLNETELFVRCQVLIACAALRSLTELLSVLRM